ncbi:MAG: hypothetical protein IK085_08950 [Clostridia bacterium]|nr:hypothetical protein [Clostridia bacterium]
MKKNKFTKFALVSSILLLITWFILGTASTLTWFNDSDDISNRFIIGNLDLKVYHKTDSGSYDPVDETTAIFNDRALYEPGYMQIVYVKIENAGTTAFDYNFSITPNDYTDGTNASGNTIHLPDYLRFGVIFGNTEEEVVEQTADRAHLVDVAATPLSNYSVERQNLAPSDSEYAAIIVYMPTEVGNNANYRLTTVPTVKLGVNVIAQQAS